MSQQPPAVVATAYLDLPPPLMLQRQDALLLDIDGTLLELAPSPDEVLVPPDLVTLLEALTRHLQSALAVISGRALATVDELLWPLKMSGAGVHGAEVRLPDSHRIRRPAPMLAPVARALRERFAHVPEVLIEDKGAAVAIHFARCPQRAAECEQALREEVAGLPMVRLQPGRSVLEAVPADTNKGDALRLLMGHTQFADRRAIYLGDDRTDESAFAAAADLGGFGIKVGEGATCAPYRLASPLMVRKWLQLGLAALQGPETVA